MNGWTVRERETRLAIKDDRRTIAYVAIGAEIHAPVLAAAPDLLAALRALYEQACRWAPVHLVRVPAGVVNTSGMPHGHITLNDAVLAIAKAQDHSVETEVPVHLSEDERREPNRRPASRQTGFEE